MEGAMRKEHVIVSVSRLNVSIEDVFSRIAQVIALWQHRHESRVDLRRLDDRLLKDIGLKPADIAWEAGKRFWEA